MKETCPFKNGSYCDIFDCNLYLHNEEMCSIKNLALNFSQLIATLEATHKDREYKE